MTNHTSWRDETIALLKNRPACLTLKEIAAQTDVSVAWVRQFARGEIDNPGVNTVQKIKEFLLNFKPKA